MIRKLRLKFVLINMSVVTIMMAAVFGLIVTFTSANLERESIHMMQDIAGQPFQLEAPDQLAENVRLPFFTLQVDPGGTLLEAGGGYYDLSNREFLDSLVRTAMASPHQLGVLDEYDLRYYRFESPQTRSVVFADISSERATLDGLLRTCLIIGVISFFGFLWASILLSKWAVRPVEQAWKEQRQFIAAASHELKTPLTVIMTNAQLMSSPGCDEQKHAKFLDSILVMSRQMKKLTEQMLELARSESAEPRLAFAPVDWSGLVSRTVLPFESVFFEKGMELKVEVEEKIQVIGEQAQLRQVVEILLDNAQKYASPGANVWVSLRRQSRGRCLLTVANQGEEIAPEDLPQLFRRFYRADPARSRNGSFGLGLSIAQSVVTRHRGRIWAQSRDGVNRFMVELPCKE